MTYCALLWIGTSRSVHAQPVPPPVKAISACLMDAYTGQILYSKNADLPRPPASTTKIMTAILLIEHCRPEEIIVASQKASEQEGSSLHLKPGEQITAHDLLYALMLRSANDGCVAAAEHIAGSEERFAEMMTERAHQIGATNTIFRNANGLNENPNTTTARDLAIMARFASKFPEFSEAVRTKVYTVRRSIDQRDCVLKNHDKMLWHFPGADGIKTGFTVPAGHCFVGAATWKGWRLISVVMHSQNAFGDTASLLKYGFNHYESEEVAPAGKVFARVPVRGGVCAEVAASLGQPLKIVTPKGEIVEPKLEPHVNPVDAPVAPGAEVGTLDAVVDGKVISSEPLVATDSVARASIVTMGTSGFPGYLLGCIVATAIVGYGTTIAKGARRRRYRLSALLRGAHRRG